MATSGGASLAKSVGSSRIESATSQAIRVPAGDHANEPTNFPLTTSCDPEVETAAWLEVLAQRLGENALPGQCHLFLRPPWSESPGELFIFHRELKPEDLGFVLHPENDYPYANVLGHPGDDAAEFRDWLKEKAGEDPTLKEVVEVALADWK